MKGFTLIELMIVMCIVGILSAVTILAYEDFNKAKEIKTDLQHKPLTIKD